MSAIIVEQLRGQLAAARLAAECVRVAEHHADADAALKLVRAVEEHLADLPGPFGVRIDAASKLASACYHLTQVREGSLEDNPLACAALDDADDLLALLQTGGAR